MIGGYDVVVAFPDGMANAALAESWKLISRLWPEVVHEIDEGQWFFYENNNAREQWYALGGTEENQNKMIQIIICKDNLTFVFGHKNLPVVAEVRSLEKSLMEIKKKPTA